MKLYIALFILSILVSFLFWQNNNIDITRFNYISNKIPDKLSGMKIVHVSDLHNKNFHGKLTKKIKIINPDIIFITGDLIDRRKTNVALAVKFIKEIVTIAPVYYVSGNHEQLSGNYEELKKELNKLHVIIMDNVYTKINIEGSEIVLLGIADPSINQNEKTYHSENNTTYMRNTLHELTHNIKTDFNILLSHRPELFEIYKEFNVDLVFSGHAHGGQIRIPFLGGILSPNQGFFPKYSEGMHREGVTSMVVSRGLGNSLFPFRIFNRPELIVVALNKE
ncbi:UDP-2,3-diacylglucosamine pyrophosphatase LpxG [bioreactor metagenome]|uniref:UDP-2,3-diacylglucosamine pyrophosphatase LpxG n=1 Tax=bioreactor metagenome TaxID=1076179 RepID=A0A644XM70_9ZZZZ